MEKLRNETHGQPFNSTHSAVTTTLPITTWSRDCGHLSFADKEVEATFSGIPKVIQLGEGEPGLEPGQPDFSAPFPPYPTPPTLGQTQERHSWDIFKLRPWMVQSRVSQNTLMWSHIGTWL